MIKISQGSIKIFSVFITMKKQHRSLMDSLKIFKDLLLLKVVSTTFLLVCFLSLNECTCQTRENDFYFNLKALFILEKIKFYYFRFSNFEHQQNKKNLGSKHGLLMKFGQFMSYSKRNSFIKKFYKKAA